MNSKRVVIVGGGAAGLGAAYTLMNRGLTPTLLEAENHVGGRLAADEVDGFLIDTGVDFFCYSYDVVFRICKELDVPLVRSTQKLGWYRNGRWLVTSADPSIPGLISNLRAFPGLGLLSWGALKLIWKIFREADYLTFASDSRMAEIDGEESFGEYLTRTGAPESLQVTLKGFVENGVLNYVDSSSQAYIRGYLANTLLRPHRLMQPEERSRRTCPGAARCLCRRNSHFYTCEGGSGQGAARDGGRDRRRDDRGRRSYLRGSRSDSTEDHPRPSRRGAGNAQERHLLLRVSVSDRTRPSAATIGLAWARSTPSTRLASCWTGPSTYRAACLRGRAHWI